LLEFEGYAEKFQGSSEGQGLPSRTSSLTKAATNQNLVRTCIWSAICHWIQGHTSNGS